MNPKAKQIVKAAMWQHLLQLRVAAKKFGAHYPGIQEELELLEKEWLNSSGMMKTWGEG